MSGDSSPPCFLLQTISELRIGVDFGGHLWGGQGQGGIPQASLPTALTCRPMKPHVGQELQHGLSRQKRTFYQQWLGWLRAGYWPPCLGFMLSYMTQVLQCATRGNAAARFPRAWDRTPSAGSEGPGQRTCEGLQQHFGDGVTCIQPMFQNHQLREAWFRVLTACGEKGTL